MSRTLVIAEHDHGALNVSTARALACARALGFDADVVVFAADGAGVAGQAATLDGVASENVQAWPSWASAVWRPARPGCFSAFRGSVPAVCSVPVIAILVAAS